MYMQHFPQIPLIVVVQELHLSLIFNGVLEDKLFFWSCI